MAFFKLFCLSADIFHSFVSCSNIVLFVCFTKAAPKQHWYDISDSQKNYLILTKFYKQKKNYLILTKFYKHLIYPYTILSFSYCLLAYTNPTNLMDVILHMEVICLQFFNVFRFNSYCFTQQIHCNSPLHHATFLQALGPQTSQGYRPVVLFQLLSYTSLGLQRIRNILQLVRLFAYCLRAHLLCLKIIGG